MPKRIGLDVGGVIIDAISNDGTDTGFRSDNFMKTTPVAGVYDAVRQLIERYGSENVFIVSKCGEVIESKTRKWLAGNGFYTHTGFNPENLIFCRTRADKAPIVEVLELSDFVDDHADVLEYMRGIVDNRYLFGPQADAIENADGLIVVNNWEETLTRIIQEV